MLTNFCFGIRAQKLGINDYTLTETKLIDLNDMIFSMIVSDISITSRVTV